jgi:hypothetical protein
MSIPAARIACVFVCALLKRHQRGVPLHEKPRHIGKMTFWGNRSGSQNFFWENRSVSQNFFGKIDQVVKNFFCQFFSSQWTDGITG